MRHLYMAAMFCVASVPLAAQTHGEHATSPYAGEEAREIVTLSPDDLAELRRGGGWGLARAAELNGVPGPAHLLELQDEIELTAAQVVEITAIRDQMQADAIAAGDRLISAERALDQAFSGTVPVAQVLAQLVEEAGTARAALRLVHLGAHLETPPILTADQIIRYNALRGYSADPCTSVPKGHDPAMWKRHNGCG